MNDKEIGWWFNEAVSLLREARRSYFMSPDLSQEIDQALPEIQEALETLVKR